MADQELFGIAGWCRVVENTYSEHNGWHTHVHALLFLNKRVSMETAEALGDRLWGRWSKGVATKGMSSMRRDRKGEDVGVSAKLVSAESHHDAMEGYFTKSVYEAAAFEVANGQGKVARGTESRTPFEILATLAGMVRSRTGDISDSYDPDQYDADLKLWHEYEKASHNRRQMTWAQGFKATIGVVEKTDEEIAEETIGDTDRVLLPHETWKEVRWIVWEVRAVVLAEGIAGLCRWLDKRGLEYLDPKAE